LVRGQVHEESFNVDSVPIERNIARTNIACVAGSAPSPLFKDEADGHDELDFKHLTQQVSVAPGCEGGLRLGKGGLIGHGIPRHSGEWWGDLGGGRCGDRPSLSLLDGGRLECLGLRGLSYRLLLQGGNFVFSYTLRPAARDYSERMEQAGADRFADLTALYPEKRWQFMQADHPLSAGANDRGRNFSR